MTMRSWIAIALLAALCGASRAQERAPATPDPSSPNPYLGGAPSPEPGEGPLRLTLKDAVDRGLEHNLGALLGRQNVREAEGKRDDARGGLLPTLTAGFSAARQEINLEAYGFPVPPGESPVVGPFNVMDARVYLAQPILDLAAWQRDKAKSEGLEAARLGERDAREIVVLTCAGLYIQAAIGFDRIEAAREIERVASRLYDRAVHLKEAGVVAGIEVLRAKVELDAQRQRVILYENDFEKQKLALARAIGVPLSRPIELADALVFRPLPPLAVDPLLAEAYASRADLQQAEKAVAAAEATRKADTYDALPSLRFNADLGWIGPTSPRLERTFFVGAGLRIPLYEAGKIRAKTLQDDAALERLRARSADLRARVELEVRSALLDLQAADERVRVAQGALELAQEQLRQSEDRFAAGVASNLEVVQAQDAVATASDNRLSALYAHNLARFALARAVGGAERALATFLSSEQVTPHD